MSYLIGDSRHNFVFDCDIGHSMCLQCFTNYIEDALTNRHFILHSQYGYTIQCPAGCDGSEVKETEHFRMLGPKKHNSLRLTSLYVRWVESIVQHLVVVMALFLSLAK